MIRKGRAVATDDFLLNKWMFKDSLSLTISDPLHSLEEQRFVTIGESVEREILVVDHTQQERNIRIISAREATRKERRDYGKR